MEEISLNPIEKLRITIKNKNAIIFCRVSSIRQTGLMHISFEVQEQKGNNCANFFNLKVYSIIKVVESAYDGKKCTLKTLINKNKGKNIIIYNITRFSRNKNHGLSLLYHALKNNVRLFFVDEGIIWDKDNQDNIKLLEKKLEYAEEESRQIGKRVKDALEEKKRRGYFTGGIPKYGYKTVAYPEGKKLVPEEYEQEVINFVKMCKTVGFKVSNLNKQMKNISYNYENILLFYEDTPIYEIQEPLTNSNIADLLNNYSVLRRNNIWSSSSVGVIVNEDYKQILEKIDQMNFAKFSFKK